MRKISLNFLYPLTALVLFIFVLNRNVFMLPALGMALNPFRGIVQNEADTPSDQELKLDTENEVKIVFDERQVPHVFASSESDMFFAQGYVCASDRLWQMDFMSYASAGRLSEIFGIQFLDYDRTQRRNGMLGAAEVSLEYIETHPETKAALDKYTAGVNAYIASLQYGDLPLEYKLLDYQPEPWTNLKSVLIMKYMSATLSGYEEDISASYLKLALGEYDYDQLFSHYRIEHAEDSLAIAQIRDTLPIKNYLDFSFLESSGVITTSEFNPRLGSNSWVVGETKSASGNAILCSDPHLNLSLPAIWYELQLKSENQNAYGYSIPGVPGVVIGFNEKISWGLTNGATDVRDYYKVELTPDYAFYNYDGEWLETKQEIEEIKIRQEDTFFDTVYYTVHGPVFSDFRFGPVESEGCAVNWTLHDPSNEFRTFLELNRASDYNEFKNAITHYKCPVQNFSFADTEGNIALHHQGKIKKREWKGQGEFILDGTSSAVFEVETLTRLPQVFNPDEDFVYSANNNPFKDSNTVMVHGHYTEFRADKIRAHLQATEKFTIEDMKAMQLDNTNRLAELAIPVLLNCLKDQENEYLKSFANWDADYNIDSELALIFESWWTHIKINTWDELQRFQFGNKLPDDLVLLYLIVNAPESEYFDLRLTPEIETANEIVSLSFQQVWENVGIHHTWGELNNANLTHLSNLPDFSRLGIQQGGHPDALNAISKNWGPSLRMIVEMDDRPKGYGIYAGGQSGNPASNRYDSFVDDWASGQYYELHFFRDDQEANENKTNVWIIK